MKQLLADYLGISDSMIEHWWLSKLEGISYNATYLKNGQRTHDRIDLEKLLGFLHNKIINVEFPED